MISYESYRQYQDHWNHLNKLTFPVLTQGCGHFYYSAGFLLFYSFSDVRRHLHQIASEVAPFAAAAVFAYDVAFVASDASAAAADKYLAVVCEIVTALQPLVAAVAVAAVVVERLY